jgi:hypothetical protein
MWLSRRNQRVLLRNVGKFPPDYPSHSYWGDILFETRQETRHSSVCAAEYLDRRSGLNKVFSSGEPFRAILHSSVIFNSDDQRCKY